MSRLYGAPERDAVDRLPVGTIRRRLAFALFRRLGEWVTTEDLIDVAYADGGPLDAKNTLKSHVHLLRDRLPGYVIEGDRWNGRRLRKAE